MTRSSQLANVAAEYNGCFQFNGFQMVLQPESGVPEMLTKIKTLQIGNEFRVRPGAKAAGMQSIKYMEDAQKRGQDLYGVVIPYQHIRRFNLDDCFLFNGLPTWEAIKNSSRSQSQAPRQRDVRRKIEQERIACEGKLEFPEWHGWDRVVFEHLEKPELKKLELKNVEEISRLTEKAPVDAFFDTWLEDNLNSADLLSRPRQRSSGTAGRDDQIRHQLDRHRRGRASGPLFLARRADQNARLLAPRQESLQSRTAAVHKITGFPAKKTAPQPRRAQAKVCRPT